MDVVKYCMNQDSEDVNTVNERLNLVTDDARRQLEKLRRPKNISNKGPKTDSSNRARLLRG